MDDKTKKACCKVGEKEGGRCLMKGITRKMGLKIILKIIERDRKIHDLAVEICTAANRKYEIKMMEKILNLMNQYKSLRTQSKETKMLWKLMKDREVAIGNGR